MSVTYKLVGLGVRVYLDRKHVGTIKRGNWSGGCWCYFPKGSSKGGEPNHSLDEIKRYLEVRDG